MKKYGPVHSCIILRENGRSRGFGFVTFASHEVAKHVSTIGHSIQGKEFGCSLIMPNKEAKHQQIDRKNRKIYIKVRDKQRLTEEEVYDIFSKYGRIAEITILKESKERSGFVLFEDKQPVEKLLQNPQVPFHDGFIMCEACLSRKEVKKTKKPEEMDSGMDSESLSKSQILTDRSHVHQKLNASSSRNPDNLYVKTHKKHYSGHYDYDYGDLNDKSHSPTYNQSNFAYDYEDYSPGYDSHRGADPRQPHLQPLQFSQRKHNRHYSSHHQDSKPPGFHPQYSKIDGRGGLGRYGYFDRDGDGEYYGEINDDYGYYDNEYNGQKNGSNLQPAEEKDDYKVCQYHEVIAPAVKSTTDQPKVCLTIPVEVNYGEEMHENSATQKLPFPSRKDKAAGYGIEIIKDNADEQDNKDLPRKHLPSFGVINSAENIHGDDSHGEPPDKSPKGSQKGGHFLNIPLLGRSNLVAGRLSDKGASLSPKNKEVFLMKTNSVDERLQQTTYNNLFAVEPQKNDDSSDRPGVTKKDNSIKNSRDGSVEARQNSIKREILGSRASRSSQGQQDTGDINYKFNMENEVAMQRRKSFTNSNQGDRENSPTRRLSVGHNALLLPPIISPHEGLNSFKDFE
jgi:hypothetical protein